MCCHANAAMLLFIFSSFFFFLLLGLISSKQWSRSNTPSSWTDLWRDLLTVNHVILVSLSKNFFSCTNMFTICFNAHDMPQTIRDFKKKYFQTTTAVIDRYMIVLIYMLVVDFCNHSYLLKSSWQHFWTTTSVPLKSETLNNPTQSMGGTKRIPGKNKVQPYCSMFFWWKCAII